MTEYERGYAEGYKDGFHRFMPEAPSVPIPPIDAAIAEERAEGAKPDPGDVVAFASMGDGHPIVHAWPGGVAPSCYVVLMRAADVRRKIKEAGK